MNHEAALIDLARIVNNRYEKTSYRLFAARLLHERAPELNGGNWILIGQKKGFTADECREIKEAMQYGLWVINPELTVAPIARDTTGEPCYVVPIRNKQ